MELHAASEAAAAGGGAGAGGGSGGIALPATAALQLTQAGAAAGGLQGFGSTLPLPGSSSGLASGMQQQQQGVAAAAVAAGSSGAALPTDTAAAALAALFADAGVAPGGELRAMSDVQLTGDQGAPLALDSFTGGEQECGGRGGATLLFFFLLGARVPFGVPSCFSRLWRRQQLQQPLSCQDTRRPSSDRCSALPACACWFTLPAAAACRHLPVGWGHLCRPAQLQHRQRRPAGQLDGQEQLHNGLDP